MTRLLWQDTGWIWLFLPAALLLATGLWRLYARRKLLQETVLPGNLNRLAGRNPFRTDILRLSFWGIAACCFVLAALNPQVPGKEVTVEHKGSDVFIALDISRSMLVDDVAPNRLGRAVHFAQTLARDLEGERIGLIFFAGSAFIQMPLSLDQRAVQIFLQNADPELVTNQGTAIGDAIDLALSAQLEDPGRGKALVIISDGEDHDPATLGKAAEAARQGWVLCTVGVGTESGGAVPADPYSGEHIVSEEGRPVVSRYDAATLRQVAREGRGVYIKLSENSKDAAAKVRSEMARLEKTSLQWQSYRDFDSYFQYPLLVGLLFYALYMIWPYRNLRK